MVMTADYEGLATELLQVNGALLQLPALHLQVRLNQGEPFVLNYLLLHHQAHPVELSRSGAVSSARIAALLGRLEDKGYITRGPDPLNNRQVIVTLSPKGLEVIQKLSGPGPPLHRPDALPLRARGRQGVYPPAAETVGQPHPAMTR